MTENVLLKENNHSDRLPWPFAETKAGALGNSNTTAEGSAVGMAHVAPSKGHWWHPCRYRDELLNTWIRVCNPVSSRWRAWQNSKPPALEWYQVTFITISYLPTRSRTVVIIKTNTTCAPIKQARIVFTFLD